MSNVNAESNLYELDSLLKTYLKEVLVCILVNLKLNFHHLSICELVFTIMGDAEHHTIQSQNFSFEIIVC